MSKTSIVPAGRYSHQSKIVNSRFIATIEPAATVEAAKLFISEIKREYPDATHNVPIYLIGHGKTVTSHCSDDGEPSGTAGRPALSVLSGSGLGDTVMVITRYFGGTKLGTGGLVKAYSDSARAAIKGVKKAQKVIVHHLKINSPYNLYERITRSVRLNNGRIDNEIFTDQVEITTSIPVGYFDALVLSIKELSNGKISPSIVAENIIEYIPLK